MKISEQEIPETQGNENIAVYPADIELKEHQECNHIPTGEKLNIGQTNGRKRPFYPRKKVSFTPIVITDGENAVSLAVEKTFHNSFRFIIRLNGTEITPLSFPSISNAERFLEHLCGILKKEDEEKTKEDMGQHE